MSSQDESETRSPFTRPGFIAAAIVVLAIVVVGVVLGVINATRAEDEPPAAGPTASEPAPAPQPSEEPSPPSADESVCGLEEANSSNSTLAAAPATEWQFHGTTAYPTSPAYGPGASDGGVRYCFQRSPEGALFMAANAVSQGSDSAVSTAWADYAVAAGPYRDELIEQMTPGEGASSGTRLSIAGFRLLHYDGQTARVDLAVRGSSDGEGALLSGVYDLVWQDGDWRISADVSQPLDMAAIPDTAGYVSWGQ